MSPSNWGPSTWIFMHTLAAKIKEQSFSDVAPSLILLLIKICYNLPCPECSEHSKIFWSQVKPENITTKSDLINVLYLFHNIVNKRTKKPIFRQENLGYYSTKSVIETYNKFIRNFNTHGNMNLINESFHRNLLLSSLKNWLILNIQHFEM